MLNPSEVLPNVLAARAASAPERVFARIVGASDLTYGALEAETRAWMGRLSAEGVAAGDRVIVMLPNTALLPVWMAIARLGAIEVPVNTAYRGRFLEHMLVNSGARCGVIAPEFAERFASLAGALGECRTILLTAPAAVEIPRARIVLALAVDGDAPAGVEPAAHEPAAILYTSGTTGASKGAIVSWEQAFRTAEACPPLDDLGRGDVRYSPYPMFHMSGKLAVCATAALDGQLVIRDGFSTSEFWGEIDRYGCTTTMLIGATANFIAKLPPTPSDRDHPLRNVLLAPPPEDPIAFCDRFGLRASAVFNMTELSCPISSGWDVELLARGSVGRVRDGYAVRIVDDHDRELGAGEIGEIVVRADQPWRLMGGYWQMPERTVDAWRNLWFHTGDLGRVDADGAFFFLDRKKDAIRRRGENISSMELEAEICEFADVAEAAVVGHPSEVGEEDVRVLLVAADPERFDPRALIEFLGERVPAFMLPRYVTVVDALPKTPTEKVRKHELRELPIDERTWERPTPARQ